mmetsp:Transcript_96749/g.311832  ORF Transcript_96749/g.311832 Transcript_96749/m.311832 type:complete len:254 (+) Transcript_96749:289-1050(+)
MMTFFFSSTVSTCKSSMPHVWRMLCTMVPPLPMTTPPSSQAMSISWVTLVPAFSISASSSALAATTLSCEPVIVTSWVLRSMDTETSCLFSSSRSLLVPLAVSDLVAAAGTSAILSENDIVSWDFSISAVAWSFSACVPLISSMEFSPPLPLRMSCTFAPVDVFTASTRSVVHSRACSADSRTTAGTMPASVMHSLSVSFHLSTSALLPKRSTPSALRTTVRPELSLKSPNLVAPLPVPPPLPLPLAAMRRPS